MANAGSPVTIGHIPPEELEEILQRIDEKRLSGELSPVAPFGTVGGRAASHLLAPEAHPPFSGLDEQVAEIRSADAPYYAVKGAWAAKLFRRFHNLVVKIFGGRKQAYFNQHILLLLEQLISFLSHLRAYSEEQAVFSNAVARKAETLQEQFVTLQNDYRALSDYLGTVAARQAEDHQRLENLSREMAGLPTWMDAREFTPLAAQPSSAWPEPRIVDPQGYAQRLAEMRTNIRVNLGCGEKPLEAYLNVDARSLPGVDIVADAHRLPFEPGSVFEVASAHLIEHFREHHARVALLPYWLGLLQPGGQLRVICPNWAAMLARLNAGQMPLPVFKKLTFGAQNYEGDDHFAMYTPEALEKLLLEAGFTRVEQVILDRMNGDCPEMEFLAYR